MRTFHEYHCTLSVFLVPTYNENVFGLFALIIHTYVHLCQTPVSFINGLHQRWRCLLGGLSQVLYVCRLWKYLMWNIYRFFRFSRFPFPQMICRSKVIHKCSVIRRVLLFFRHLIHSSLRFRTYIFSRQLFGVQVWLNFITLTSQIPYPCRSKFTVVGSIPIIEYQAFKNNSSS